jgi:glycosyltransferase involved in cell wall biosynthesis
MTNAIPPKSYALVSACRNEENYLDGLAACIAAQTLKPVRWIIVDDGSTDATYQRASALAARLPFVSVVRMPATGQRSFASQVYAAQHGYKLLQGDSFHYIGFLDADIQMPPDYYDRLVARLDEDPKLGLCGGALWDRTATGDTYIRQGSEDYHVPGGIQLFRRACFDQFGGYHADPGRGAGHRGRHHVPDARLETHCIHRYSRPAPSSGRLQQAQPAAAGTELGSKILPPGLSPDRTSSPSPCGVTFRRTTADRRLLSAFWVFVLASRHHAPLGRFRSEFVSASSVGLQLTRLRRALIPYSTGSTVADN